MRQQLGEPLKSSFTRRVLTVVAIATAALIILFLGWRLLDILLLVFAGGLLGIFFSGISGWVQRHTPLSHRAALSLIVIVLLVALALTVLLAAPNIAQQSEDLVASLMASLGDVRAALADTTWAQPLLARIDSLDGALSLPSGVMDEITNAFTATFTAAADFAIVGFLGFYLAWEPDLYVKGLLKLAPKRKRERLGQVFDELAYTLRWWLIGRFASMTIVGLLSLLGLWLLGIPLAFILALLAGLLAFIPILGPTLALVPPVLVAFTISPQQALYVFLLYMGIQIVESYILTPVIQREATSLPPGLLIFSQLTMGVLGGLPGLAIAPPLAATGMVLVKMLYVEDVLEDDYVYLLKAHPRDRFEAEDRPQAAVGEGNISPIESPVE